MEHSIDNEIVQLDESELGIVVYPSETAQLVPSVTNVRDFMLKLQRFYGIEPLEINEDYWELKLSDAKRDEDFDGIHDMCVSSAVVVEVLIRQKDGSSIGDQLGSSIQNELALGFGQSQVSKARGTRAVFITGFEEFNHETHGEVYRGYAIVGKNVFFNDYRVLMNFPILGTDQEEKMLEDVFKRLHQNAPLFWNSLNLELSIVDETDF